jgi:hypothetical protein
MEAAMAFFGPRPERRRRHWVWRYASLVREVGLAHRITVVFSEGAHFLMRLERHLPELSSYLGQVLPRRSDGLRWETAHVDADPDTITSAQRLLTPGLAAGISMAGRKGSTLLSTSSSMQAMAAFRTTKLVQMQAQHER